MTPGGSAGSADNGDFIYYDNVLKVTFSFNPITLAAEVVSAEPLEQPTSSFHADLTSQVQSYVGAAFRKGKALYSVQQQGDDEGHQQIIVSCQNNKLDSFWAGEWQSTWTLEAGKLSGELMIRAHYFEMGNMQFNLD